MEIKRPLGPRILIMQDNANEITPGGIYIPDTAMKDPIVWGTVVSVGTPTHATCDKCEAEVLLDAEPGDRILFPPSQGNFFSIGGRDHVLIDAERCLAIETVK